MAVGDQVLLRDPGTGFPLSAPRGPRIGRIIDEELGLVDVLWEDGEIAESVDRDALLYKYAPAVQADTILFPMIGKFVQLVQLSVASPGDKSPAAAGLVHRAGTLELFDDPGVTIAGVVVMSMQNGRVKILIPYASSLAPDPVNEAFIGNLYVDNGRREVGRG